MYIKCLLLLSAATLLVARRMPHIGHIRHHRHHRHSPVAYGRIIGGQDECISNAPWQVSLQRRGSHICGGSIYNDRIIVTAAHCVIGSSSGLLRVRVGATKNNDGGTLVNVSAILVHENYMRPANDVAVLLLSSPLDLNSKAEVQAIKLAKETPAHGDHATVTGWGYTAKYLPVILQSLDVTIVERDMCRKAFGNEITEDMICAMSPLPGKDACYGDSGGPLVSNGLLVGIVSWGNGCALPDYPGVYADVAVLHDWIVNAAANVTQYNRNNGTINMSTVVIHPKSQPDRFLFHPRM